MERCALALRLPSGVEDDPKTAEIELSLLDVSRPLDPSVISWSSRPLRRNIVGTLRASAGEEVRLPEFPCKWGALYAFEASCASDSTTCDVDVWADRKGTWGTCFSFYVCCARSVSTVQVYSCINSKRSKSSSLPMLYSVASVLYRWLRSVVQIGYACLAEEPH